MTIHYTNQDAHNDITEQFTQFKRIQTDRASRIDFSNRLTEQYFAINGKIPPVAVLDRLATLILQDELADKHPDKMTRNEYPLISDTQLDLRHKQEVVTDFITDDDDNTGVRSNRVNVYLASDGKSYRLPIRRTRDIGELIRNDFTASKARNLKSPVKTRHKKR